MRIDLLKTVFWLLLVCGMAGAQPIQNGDFSAPVNPTDGSGWEAPLVFNGTDVNNRSFTSGPTGQAIISAAAGDTNVLPSDLEAAFNNAFDLTTAMDNLVFNSSFSSPNGGTVGARGSFFFQDFQASAFGDTITFTYGFDRGDSVDIAFGVMVDLSDNSLVAPTTGVNNSNVVEVAPTGVGSENTPVNAGGSWTVTPNGGAGYRIGFLVVHGNNNNSSSDLGIDSVVQTALAAVPEINANAAALPVVALGLILIVIGDGRRRKALSDI